MPPPVFIPSIPVPFSRLHSPRCHRRCSYFPSPPNLRPRQSQVFSRPSPRCALPLPPLSPSILRTSFAAISKLLSTLALGVIFARLNLLPPATLTALSRTVFCIFLPSLLFTNILLTLSTPSLPPSLFCLPVAALLQVVFGLILSLILSRLLRLNRAESKLLLVCVSFGNTAALPLLFANSLFPPGPKLSMLISSLSFYIVGWTTLFWSVAYLILTTLPDPFTPPQTSTSVPLATTLRSVSKRVLAPPILATFAALLIGVNPIIRSTFLKTPIFPALQTLGAGYSPAAVLILAGSLARKREESEQKPVLNKDGLVRVGVLAGVIAVCRFAIMPFWGIFLSRLDLFQGGNDVGKFVRLAVLLESVMPPAQNSTLILTLEGKPEAASGVAKILLVVYLAGVLPISAILTAFLGMAGV